MVFVQVFLAALLRKENESYLELSREMKSSRHGYFRKTWAEKLTLHRVRYQLGNGGWQPIQSAF